jgi:hypothetical protein
LKETVADLAKPSRSLQMMFVGRLLLLRDVATAIAKTSKQHIFTQELLDVKSLEVFFESIPGFLIFDDQLLDDVTKGGE